MNNEYECCFGFSSEKLKTKSTANENALLLNSREFFNKIKTLALDSFEGLKWLKIRWICTKIIEKSSREYKEVFGSFSIGKIVGNFDNLSGKVGSRRYYKLVHSEYVN